MSRAMEKTVRTVARDAHKITAIAHRRLSSTLAAHPFEIFRDIAPLRSYRKSLIQSNRTLGFVPTMGALHAGHLSLIRQAAAENTDVVVSIYVNPTQFGVNEDLASYPRTWTTDLQLLEELDAELARGGGQSNSHSHSHNQSHSATTQTTRQSGRISAIFAPTTSVMYPSMPPSSEVDGDGSFVTITPLSRYLEGASRPVFFRGVATVCMKLFNAVTPDRVYLGQKDVQQTVVLRRMVRDFLLGTEVRVGPTVREADGLAMSSRNVYLGQRRRKIATVLAGALKKAEDEYLAGTNSREAILQRANTYIGHVLAEQQQAEKTARALFEVDYISLADPDSLEEASSVDEARGAVLSGAIKMLPLEETLEGEAFGLGGDAGPVRLIDNIILKPRN